MGGRDVAGVYDTCNMFVCVCVCIYGSESCIACAPGCAEDVVGAGAPGVARESAGGARNRRAGVEMRWKVNNVESVYVCTCNIHVHV